MQLIGPLLFLFGIGMFVLIYGMVLKARRNERLAKLYEKALEQGVDPHELQFSIEDKEAGDPQGNLKAGIILLAAAIGILLGLMAADRMAGVFRLLGFAIVPACIGIAVIFIHYSVRR